MDSGVVVVNRVVDSWCVDRSHTTRGTDRRWCVGAIRLKSFQEECSGLQKPDVGDELHTDL